MLEKPIKESGTLAAPLSRLSDYLNDLCDQAGPNASAEENPLDITPQQVSEHLSVDEGLALVLLSEFEKAGILSHRYDLICPQLNQIMTSFEDVEDLPAEMICGLEENATHSIQEYFVQLVFRLTVKRVRNAS